MPKNRTFNGLLLDLQQKVEEYALADKLPDPNAKGVLLPTTDHPFMMIELINYLHDPKDINLAESGEYLKQLRNKYTTKELLSWFKQFYHGKWWPKLSEEAKNALLYGNTIKTKGEAETV